MLHEVTDKSKLLCAARTNNAPTFGSRARHIGIVVLAVLGACALLQVPTVVSLHAEASTLRVPIAGICYGTYAVTDATIGVALPFIVLLATQDVITRDIGTRDQVEVLSLDSCISAAQN